MVWRSGLPDSAPGQGLGTSSTAESVVAQAPDGGLSSAEAAARLSRYGPVVGCGGGGMDDAGVIAAVIVLNTAAGVTQEVKAGQARAAGREPEPKVLAGSVPPRMKGERR